MELGDIHYNIWNNHLGCDSLTIKAVDSTFTGRLGEFSLHGISWIKNLVGGFAPDNFSNAEMNAEKISLKFFKSHDEYRIGILHLSVPDSTLTLDTIKYHKLISDERFFARSKFRQTRYKFDINKINMLGLNTKELFQGKAYKIRSVDLSSIIVDILVNRDKPFDESARPEMPNEAASSLKKIIHVDSLQVSGGQLSYKERYKVNEKPAEVTFSKINVAIEGLSTDTIAPGTTRIYARGQFMNTSEMKLAMAIPLTSKNFSLKYSGSLNTIDLTKLNPFLEPGENHRTKSGTLQSAKFDVQVNDGHATGTLQADYTDLSIAVLDEKTGSEGGLMDKLESLIGKIFVIRATNIPDDRGKYKIGKIDYFRKPTHYFMEFVWFSIRSGLGDIVGFKPK